MNPEIVKTERGSHGKQSRTWHYVSVNGNWIYGPVNLAMAEAFIAGIKYARAGIEVELEGKKL